MKMFERIKSKHFILTYLLDKHTNLHDIIKLIQH